MTREPLRFSKRVRWTFAALLSITVIGAIVLSPFITRVDASLRQRPVPLRHAFGTIGDDLGSWSRAVGRDGQPRPDMVFRENPFKYMSVLDRVLGHHYVRPGPPRTPTAPVEAPVPTPQCCPLTYRPGNT